MEHVQKLIGERIRFLRKVRGWSQEELAERANIHFSYIGQVERGEKNASIETLGKILLALEKNFSEFFCDLENKIEVEDPLISQITNKLQGRSLEEQQLLLQFINLLFDWKKASD